MPKPSYPWPKPMNTPEDRRMRLQVLRRPRTPPAAGMFDKPRYCIPINESWLAEVFGVLGMLNEPDAWSLQQHHAQQQIEKLYSALLDNEFCRPAPLIETRYKLPPWLEGRPGCWLLDADALQGTLNIITRADISGDECDELNIPEAWRLPASAGGDNMNTVELNELQQQIDTLKNELEAADTLASAAYTKSMSNATDINEARQDLIGSLRWYPDISGPPPGWITIDGQRIPKLPTVSGDSLLLYDRVPDSWHDGDDVLLPLYVDLLPIGPSRDSGNAGFGLAYGDNRKLWTEDSQPAAGDKNLNVVKGRWLIYIGDATIS